MGCFNAVCNLSGLPIYHSDKIKLIVHLPALSGDSETVLIYPSDMRLPCFLPLSGQYDDYGGIENVTDDSHAKIMDSYFKELKANKFLQPTDYYRSQYDDNQDVTRWISQIGCQGFKVGRFPETIPDEKSGVFMSYSLVLQEAWDSYLASFDRSDTLRKRVSDSCDNWFSWYRKIAQVIIDNPDKPVSVWGSYRWGKDTRHARDFKDQLPQPEDIGMLSFMLDSSRDIDSNWFTDLYFDNFLRPLFLVGAFKDDSGLHRWTWFRDQYAEFMTVCSLMHCIPAFWIPHMVAGQDRNYEMHVRLAAARLKIAQRRWDQYKRENGE